MDAAKAAKKRGVSGHALTSAFHLIAPAGALQIAFIFLLTGSDGGTLGLHLLVRVLLDRLTNFKLPNEVDVLDGRITLDVTDMRLVCMHQC